MFLLADLLRERFLFLVYNSFHNYKLKCHEIKLGESCQRLMRDKEVFDNLNSI